MADVHHGDLSDGKQLLGRMQRLPLRPQRSAVLISTA